MNPNFLVSRGSSPIKIPYQITIRSLTTSKLRQINSRLSLCCWLRDMARYKPLRTRRAKEVLLAELDAVVAEDRVGRRGVEEEIRQYDTDQVILAFEGSCLPTHLQRDVPFFRAVDLRWLEFLDEGNRLRNARLQFLEAAFGVGELRGFHASQAGDTALGKVGGDLDLPRQWEHVRV